MKTIKNKAWLIIIIAVSLFIRLWWIEIFPVGITHDEMDYIINAKAIYLTGRDTSGTWSPLSLTAKSYKTPTAELPSLIMAPFIGPIKLSFRSAKIPYVIANTFLIIITSLIVFHFIGFRAAFITGLLFAINPWSIHFSRTAFEAPLAICFFLTGLYILLKTKSWKILLTFPFFFLGFFSYHGTKLLFLPFVLVIIMFHYFTTKGSKSKKPYIVLFLLSLLIFLYFTFSLKYQAAGNRTKELIFFASNTISQVVDYERRASIPTRVTQIFSNKATHIIKAFTSQYLASVSSTLLFVNGEQRGAYSTWHHGLFYYIDFILLLIGIIVMANQNKHFFYLLLSLGLIAPLPAALSNLGESYVLRAALLFPILIIFVSRGISFLICASGRLSKLSAITFVIVYFIFLTNFLYLYFYRYPVYGSEGFFFSERILSHYIHRVKNKTKQLVVVSKEPWFLFEQYLFYSKIYETREIAKEVAQTIQTEEYSYENIKFIFAQTCEEVSTQLDKNMTLIINKDIPCTKFQPSTEVPIKIIANTEDGGWIFKIYNDHLCNNYSTQTYPKPTSIKEYQLSQLDDKLFCNAWIMTTSTP
ncbi:hypothetical protein KKD62_01160 [Patescibacteria group bacterium]|nr:hypothetical protein [Patescibacteria group bacterium]MBU1931421.1 hypothetical protein [Patescibacteria group bacterium]